MVFCSFSTFEITLRLLEHAYICADPDRDMIDHSTDANLYLKHEHWAPDALFFHVSK